MVHIDTHKYMYTDCCLSNNIQDTSTSDQVVSVSGLVGWTRQGDSVL